MANLLERTAILHRETLDKIKYSISKKDVKTIGRLLDLLPEQLKTLKRPGINENIFDSLDEPARQILITVRNNNSTEITKILERLENKFDEELLNAERKYPGAYEKYNSDYEKWLDSLFEGEAPQTEPAVEELCELRGCINQARELKELMESESKLFEDEFEIADEIIKVWEEAGVPIESFSINRAKIGALFLSNPKVPSRVNYLFGEIKKLYALGQYDASAIFCRALLETVLWDRYLFFSKSRKKGNLNLEDLIEAKDSRLNAEIKELCHANREDANNILHKGISLSGDKTFTNIKYLRTIIETIF